jgi:hypothetical protein
LDGIAKCLRTTAIKKLILDGIQGPLVQNYIMERLRDALMTTKTLEYLDMSATVIDNMHIMLEGLRKNTSLKHLNLTSCKL